MYIDRQNFETSTILEFVKVLACHFLSFGQKDKIVHLCSYFKSNYLKPTDACQTNANNRKNTGIAGITSTIGRNAVYGSGRADNKRFTSI